MTCAAQLTPSSYPRLHQCLGSAVLPNVRETQPSMARGAALHRYLERISQGKAPAESLALVPEEWRYDAEAIDLSRLPDLTQGAAEVGLRWNPATGEARVITTGASREYAAQHSPPGWVPMVVDWAAMNGTAGVVVDWKSGRADQLAPAAENWQILTYAATALIAYGWTSVRALLCRIDQHPPQWDEVVIDALEADAILATVRTEILDAAAKAQEEHARTGRIPPLNVGPWCAWCPARRACPEKAKMLVAVARRAPELVAAGGHVELTPEEAGRLLHESKAAIKALQGVVDDLTALARQEPLLLPDGTTYSPAPKPRLDPAKAHEVLAQRYGQEVADRAVPLVRHASLTDASREVARALVAERTELAKQGRAPKPTLKQCEKEARAVLAAHGALTTGRELPAGEE